MVVQLIYLLCAVLFMIAIYSLSSPNTARNGNFLAIFSMFVSIATCLSVDVNLNSLAIYITILCGIFVGCRAGHEVKMTELPQMVALLNGLGGLSSALIVLSEIYSMKGGSLISVISIIIGLITFSGSIVAYVKLKNYLKYNLTAVKWLNLIFLGLVVYFAYHYLMTDSLLNLLIISSVLLGISMTIPVGGADMPVVISVLNSFSGCAVAFVGLAVNDLLLIITGTLIGSSGAILSFIMTKAMNRSILKVLWPTHSFDVNIKSSMLESVKIGTPSEIAFLLSNSNKVIIVPGFGMAASQAQNSLKNLMDILIKKYNVEVKFAIHPVAGRMPGHMNVLLAEAKIPYENVFEMADINNEFSTTDVSYVIGANDVVNPVAKSDVNSPLFGMPILEVEKSRTVVVVKRSMAQGYAGVDNPLFFASNTIMLFGDANKVTEEISKDL